MNKFQELSPEEMLSVNGGLGNPGAIISDLVADLSTTANNLLANVMTTANDLLTNLGLGSLGTGGLGGILGSGGLGSILGGSGSGSGLGGLL